MSMSMCVSVRTGVACVWLRAVCASVCVWNVLSVCVMRLVCRPGVSMKILNVTCNKWRSPSTPRPCSRPRRPVALSILFVTLAVLHTSRLLVLLVRASVQNEFFKKASTSTCAFMLPMDWVGIPMPRCSVNGACNLVRVRAIRFRLSGIGRDAAARRRP